MITPTLPSALVAERLKLPAEVIVPALRPPFTSRFMIVPGVLALVAAFAASSAALLLAAVEVPPEDTTVAF